MCVRVCACVAASAALLELNSSCLPRISSPCSSRIACMNARKGPRRTRSHLVLPNAFVASALRLLMWLLARTVHQLGPCHHHFSRRILDEWCAHHGKGLGEIPFSLPAPSQENAANGRWAPEIGAHCCARSTGGHAPIHHPTTAVLPRWLGAMRRRDCIVGSPSPRQCVCELFASEVFANTLGMWWASVSEFGTCEACTRRLGPYPVCARMRVEIVPCGGLLGSLPACWIEIGASKAEDLAAKTEEPQGPED